MKTMIGLVAMLAMGCTTVGAEGPEGPAGNTGPKGDTGEAGTTGMTGDAGPQGNPGSSDYINQSIQCIGNGTMDSTLIAFRYQTDHFYGGSMFVSATVSNGTLSASNSAYFAPTQTGYATTPLVIELDLVPSAEFGYFVLSLDRDAMMVSASYEDDDLDGGPIVLLFPSTDCTMTSFPAPQ
jgi:hypothetical protein